MFFWIFVGVTIFAALLLLSQSIFFVGEKSIAIVERFGKFLRLQEPGLAFKTPFIDWVADCVDLRQQQMDVEIQTKTKDNVFVSVDLSVQFKVIQTSVYESYYALEDADEQIKSYVYDVVRSTVPTLNLDEVFEKKDEIADKLKTALDAKMKDFGFDIIGALVTDIDPDKSVQDAMNKINASLRLKEAAANDAEAAKITVVKAAEAEAESKALQGAGIAKQRQAIAEGLKKSVEELKSATGVDAKEVLTTLLLTQHYDTMRELGMHGTRVVFINPNPSGMTDIRQQMIEANQA